MLVFPDPSGLPSGSPLGFLSVREPQGEVEGGPGGTLDYYAPVLLTFLLAHFQLFLREIVNVACFLLPIFP